jgi:hypothetical protein
MRWLVFILVLLSAAPAGAQPRLVIAPPGPAAWRALFAHPEQWPQSRARTGTFLFADHTLTEVGVAIVEPLTACLDGAPSC